MSEKETENPPRATSNFSRTTDRHDVPDNPEIEAAQMWLLRESLKHLHGPEEISYEKDELVVLCLLRNGRTFVEPFVEHYASLGAKHLVFLDNGSTDGTVEALKSYDNVTVLRSQLPYKEYQVLFKKHLIESFGRGRWSLYVDVDELFDYPYSDAVGLRSFLGYLHGKGYTAVVSYMLDMFPEEPLSEVGDDGAVPLKKSHRFYDISNVRAYGYREVGDIGNVVSNEEIDILIGGVQADVFQIYPLLMKHPLIFLDEKIKPMDLSDHWAGNARVADITGVLFHYKLSGSLYQSVRREAEEQRYVNRHNKYEKYSKVLTRNPSLSIKGETARELESVNDLIGTRFLVVSEEYMRFVAAEERAGTAPSSDDGELRRMYEVFARVKSEARLQQSSAEELQRQVRQLQRQRRNLQQRIRDLQQRTNGGHQRAAALGKRNRNLEARAEDLERQIEAVHSSRSWKLLTVLSRIKSRVLKRGRK